MADIIVSIAIEVVKCVSECLAPSAERRIGYLREYKSNFEKLEAEVEKLKTNRTSIQQRVDAAKRNVEEIEENVQKWLERADEFDKKAQELLQRAGKKVIPSDSAAGRPREDEGETAARKRCLKGLCPDLKKRYQLSKEAVALLEDVGKHLEACKFDRISHPVILKDPQLYIKGYVAFESRASLLTEIISSLKDADVNIVGIYGMGGIGKTTLAKAVANHPEINKFFDPVIFVEVTEKPNIVQIQRRIGEKLLGLQLFEQESEFKRAEKLCGRLKQEKSVLIILDNIWGHLDLQAIGIPHKDEHKGCKLLLTSRSIDVLSTKMDSQRNFQVGLLNDEEAWNLFQKMSGRDYNEGSELESVAKKVANKCAHLPILIVTVARALSNKPLYMWKDFLLQMVMSPSEDVRGIYESIELSYKYLAREELQKTLLLIQCASLTSNDELLMYGMGLGLFERINRMEARRGRVQTLIQQLKYSCLLLDGDTPGKDFSMHNVVRDVVKSIALRDRHAFTNEGVDEWEWPDESTLKACSSIVLKDVETGELPPVLECQQLKLLSISATNPAYYVDLFSLLRIHNDFFKKMTQLKVLVLANMEFSSLPKSLCFLSNLRGLGLYHCKLDDVAIIGELKKLEILSLRNSRIKQLPLEVGHLIRLKSLDLTSCLLLSVIQPNVFSSLSNLEELYMSELQWEDERLNEVFEKASLDDLKHLSKLTCLELQIHHANTLPRDLSFKTLERYKIAIEHQNDTLWNADEDWRWSFTTPNSCRKFKLSLTNANICLNDGHIIQLKGIEDLCLIGLQDMKSVLYELDTDGFPQLKYLQVRDNDNLLCIVDSIEHTTSNIFPVLELLLIGNLVNLEKICRAQITAESSFSQLRRIEVRGCHKLENIFSLSIARRLQQLELIDVNDCENMEDIFVIEKVDKSNSNSEVIDNIKLSQLRSLNLQYLPRLRDFCSKLETFSMSQQRRDEIILEDDSGGFYILFTEKVTFPNLEKLELVGINAQRIWQNHVVAVSSGIKNLTSLTICELNNLTCLFSASIASNCIQLQCLEVYDCYILEEIVVTDGGDCIEFPSLETLSIQGCKKLKQFVVQNTSTDHLKEISVSFFNEKVVLANLDKLFLSKCDSLRCLFSSSMVKSFARLRNLSILKCATLEVIFDMEAANSEDTGSAVVSQLSELYIDDLPKLRHVWNKDPQGLVSFQNLKTIIIDGCDVLKNIFPASIARSLSQLKDLRLTNCGVEEIVFAADQKGEETITSFVFPRVDSLRLEYLPNLTTFFSGICTVEWPAIKKLEVSDWEAMVNFLKSKKEGEPQISFEKVLPNLKELIGTGEGVANIWQFLEDCCRLKYLHVYLDESSVISSLDFLQRFHNMKMLKIQGGEDSPLFEVVENALLIHISNIDVCSDLKHLWKEESNMDHLVTSEVSHCKNLINNLAASSTSFRNLTTLEVSFCNGLTSIVTSSTAKSLVQLREMTLYECDMLTDVVAADDQGDDEANDHGIVFSKLEELCLSCLDSLTSFCSAKYTLKFPSLKILVVVDCPKIKSFSGGELSTPELQKVTYQETTIELRKGDLNTTIQELHEEGLKNIDDDDKDVETEDVAGNGNLGSDNEDDLETEKEEEDEEDVETDG